MIVEKAKITEGQVQLPERIRVAMGAGNGDEVLFKQKENGEIVMELLKKRKLSELAGILPVKKTFPGTLEEEGITKEKAAEKVESNERCT